MILGGITLLSDSAWGVLSKSHRIGMMAANALLAVFLAATYGRPRDVRLSMGALLLADTWLIAEGHWFWFPNEVLLLGLLLPFAGHFCAALLSTRSRWWHTTHATLALLFGTVTLVYWLGVGHWRQPYFWALGLAFAVGYMPSFLYFMHQRNGLLMYLLPVSLLSCMSAMIYHQLQSVPWTAALIIGLLYMLAGSFFALRIHRFLHRPTATAA